MTPPTATDRTLAAMRLLVRSFFPQLVYWIAHEYSVAESDGATFSGVATDPAFSPQLPTRVPYSPSLAGSSCVVPAGTLAHVVFVNADPSKPRCVGFDLPSLPTTATIDGGTVAIGPNATAINMASAVAAVVRYGDKVTVGTQTGPIAFVAALPPFDVPSKVQA